MRSNPQTKTRDAFAPETFAGPALIAMAQGEEPETPLTQHQTARLVQMGFLAWRGDDVVLTRKGFEFAEDCAAEDKFIASRGGRA